MKNIRKIVAILAAVLMLCSVIPMSAFAAGDVVVDYNFDDGVAHFERGYVENGYMVFDATTADWQNAYLYANAMKANTDYVVTFKAKADKDASLIIKINNNWAGDTFESPAQSVTTEWQDFELTINSGALTGTALFLFYAPYPAGSAPIFCIDDLKVAEYVAPAVPGQIVNGDFETGDATGWNLPQVGSVKAEAAHDGAYGINVKGNGGWGGMLDQTIPVNAGKAYEISLWVKVNATGVNLQIKDGTTSGANIAGEWIEMAKATEWTQFTYIVRPTQDQLTINFCGSGAAAEDVYVDSVVVTELKDPSFDGYITNGDFETADTQSWESVWGSAQISIVDGRNGGSAMLVQAGQWQVVRQKVAVQPNTNYVVKAYGKNASNMTLLVKDGNDSGNIAQAGFASSEDFKATSVEFNSGSYSEVYVCIMGNVAGSSVIVDDFLMFEKVDPSNDGYLINGTFETGDIAPWNNLWGSCPKAEVVKGGMDDNFSLEIVSGLWKHVRQMPIAVEANTDYKITVWAKNSKDMSLLIKDGGDSKDLKNAGLNAGDEWTQFTVEFNSGEYTSIIVSFMGNSEDCYGIFDNVVMEKVVAACEHEYAIDNENTVWPTCETEGTAIYVCSKCGDSYTETLPAYHNGGMEYTPAKEAIDCANPGNIENYFCPGCNEYFADAYAQEIINPWFINTTVDCVKPEGLADCAGWTCETCGNENFGDGQHDVLACQGGTCSKCNAEIEGYGCQNYDTPACEDGVCYYCGGPVAGFGHENGAWAPCVDGECSYGCGLTYPATEDHVDADADDYCDNCWNHLACIDEDGDNNCDVCWSTMPHDCIDEDADGSCDICWSEMPVVEILYGDVNGDGKVTLMDATVLSQYLAGYEVEIDEAASDTNGDGKVTLMDATVLSQYLAGYDVTLGPAEEDPV